MLALSIIAQTLRSLTRDPGNVARLSALPAALLIAAQVMPLLAMRNPGPGTIRIAVVLAFTLGLTGMIWLAIAMHRHLLLGQRFGWLPRLDWRIVGRYVMQALPFVVVLLVAGSAMLFVIQAALTSWMRGGDMPPRWVMWSAGLLPSLVLNVMALRLFAVLPGVAADQPTRGAFAAMRGSLPVLAIIAAALLAAQAGAKALLIGVIALVTPLGSAVPLLTVVAVLQGVSVWLATLIGASLLMAVYAHYIRRRLLN